MQELLGELLAHDSWPRLFFVLFVVLFCLLALFVFCFFVFDCFLVCFCLFACYCLFVWLFIWLVCYQNMFCIVYHFVVNLFKGSYCYSLCFGGFSMVSIRAR